MADQQQGRARELVYCYNCENEWLRDQHGLICPQCNSDIVEIVSSAAFEMFDAFIDQSELVTDSLAHQIDENNDPRDNRIDLSNDDSDAESRHTAADRLPHHPLHDHNPWANHPPNPEESDLESVTFNPAPNVRIVESFRTVSPLSRRGNQGNDTFSSIFQSFATMFNAPPDDRFAQQQQTRGTWPPRQTRNQYTFTTRVSPLPNGNNNGHDNEDMNQYLNQLSAVMQTIFAAPRGTPTGGNDAHRPQPEHYQFEGHPLDILNQIATHLRNPGNAAHGDFVDTEEAFNRVLDQMMEHAQGSSAPGPASEAAIAALPKKAADKSMMGSDGKAECSVCMDAVNIGDQVTVLPCKHWFHGDCVGAWLKEHDTCPHCRQGITPKDGNDQSPRSSEQTSRHAQFSFGIGDHLHVPPNFRDTDPPPGAPGSPVTPHPNQQGPFRPGPVTPGAFTQPGMQHPYVPGGYPGYPEPRNFIQPTQPPPIPRHPNVVPPEPSPQGLQPPPYVPPLQQSSNNGRLRRPSSGRGSTHSSNGEGSGSSGSRLGGFLRSLRGGNSSHGGNNGS